MNDAAASKAFGALGNAHRVAALRLLVRAGCDGLNVKALREHIGLPPTTMNHHLRMLVDAGLVSQERNGRELISRADYARIEALGAFLMQDCCQGVFATAPTC